MDGKSARRAGHAWNSAACKGGNGGPATLSSDATGGPSLLPRHLTLLKFNRIEIRRPYFDPHPEKSATNNHTWRLGLFILLTDRHGREYIWMPCWNELDNIDRGRDLVEALNRRRCKDASKKILRGI